MCGESQRLLPMSTRTQSSNPSRTAGLLALGLVAYLLAHWIGSGLNMPPDSLASFDAQGNVQVASEDTLRWYLTEEQLAGFDVASVEAKKRELQFLRSSVADQLELYSKTTSGSNGKLVANMQLELSAQRFAEARTTWNEIERATSPATLDRFGHNSLEDELVELDGKQQAQRAAIAKLQPTAQPGFLWTTQRGAPFEVLALATLAAIASLFFRRRSLKLRGFVESEPARARTLGYCAGPLLAWILWSSVRPSLEFPQYALWIVVIGCTCGFGIPYLARALARLAGKDPDRELKRSQSTVRKSRIVAAMQDLRPTSFAELKRAASQFAAELVTAEVEDNPQS